MFLTWKKARDSNWICWGMQSGLSDFLQLNKQNLCCHSLYFMKLRVFTYSGCFFFFAIPTLRIVTIHISMTKYEQSLLFFVKLNYESTSSLYTGKLVELLCQFLNGFFASLILLSFLLGTEILYSWIHPTRQSFSAFPDQNEIIEFENGKSTWILQK